MLNVLRDVVDAEVTNSLQHLRRFVKPEFLPRHLRSPGNGDGDGESIDVSEISVSSTYSSRDSKSTTSHVLICPTSTISLSALESLFQEHKALFEPLQPHVRVIEAPVFAPTSAVQASQWSETYWPTIYRNTNPYGPHPALVKHAEADLLAGGDADRYMAMARRVAKEPPGVNAGADVGVVIVERYAGKKTRIVAVARDARYTGIVDAQQDSRHEIPNEERMSNPMGHAVLRAIAMVAQKRRVIAQSSESTIDGSIDTSARPSPLDDEPTAFVSRPLSEKENQYLLATDNLLPNGYLCLDLEIYLTHEPCVMCAMALLHSRFGRVIFGKRMSRTGALSAELDSLGHGLFWRDHLNWKFLTWQWLPSIDEHEEADEVCEDDIHA